MMATFRGIPPASATLCRLLKPQFTGLQPKCRSYSQAPSKHPPDFAFAFDIDGVLLRSARPLPRAGEALNFLQKNQIPFILLTNGGGKSETERVHQLSQLLELPLDTSMFVQSHTPFAELVGKPEDGLKDKTVLVLGGEGQKCRHVAENYGFRDVITPGDLITAYPDLMPFASPINYVGHTRELSQKTLASKDAEKFADKSGFLKIDAVMVFNDPRDWVLDTQLVLDLLMSHQGYLGSLSSKNGEKSLPNKGYQQDGQPLLYFSNPDLFWAAGYHLPRLGQGAFREAFEGVWGAVTGGEKAGVKLKKKMFGKPFHGTFSFAEKRLVDHRKRLLENQANFRGLRNVYMIGDNPESDILGANQYESPHKTRWHSILVRSGVYDSGEPAHKPKTIVQDVWKAVEWAMKHSENTT